ncbi:MAG: MCE family protein [Campylobacteraceae bacterium]|nr:MCE family protein [Campylobacteraceae bacterium]
MENRSSFTIVGMFTTVVALLIAGFVWWITTKSDSSVEYTTYYIHTKTLPTNLKEGGSVKYLGVPAGFVKRIDFADNGNYDTIELVLDINKEFPIKKDSVANVEIQGIGGIVSLNIEKGYVDFEKDEKRIIKLEAGLLSKLNEEAGKVSENINSVLNNVNLLLSEENVKNFSDTLKSIESLTKKLDSDENFKRIASILESTDSILKEFDKNKTSFMSLVANFDELVQNSNEFSKTSTKTSANFNKTLSLVNKSLENGEYNIKEILSPTLHETSIALIELKKTLREFQNALFRLEDDPYDFFFRDVERKK